VERSATILLEHATKHGLDFWQTLGRSYMGQLLIKRGDFGNGVRCLRAGIEGLRRARYVLRSPGLLGALAEGFAGIGEISQALAATDEALVESERTDERWNMAELLRIKAKLLLLLGAQEAAPAEAVFRQALDWARRQGALSLELRASTNLAMLLRDQGRCADAIRLLLPVYQQFTEGFDTADLRAARKLLDDLTKLAGA
jgi:predicted ATPase